MNSTPNYGYETHISAISIIDRDMKRVEDKADGNAAEITRHAERITRGEERLACLAKQKCDVYCKCEADRLLDGKVDKKDGHGLIPDECLHQICTNKGDISLLEQYIRELQERNRRLEEEVANKVNIGADFRYYDISGIAMDNVESITGLYGINQAGLCEVSFTATLKHPLTTTYTPFLTLPVGFRPIHSPRNYHGYFGGEDGTVGVGTTGVVSVRKMNSSTASPTAVQSSFIFTVEQ